LSEDLKFLEHWLTGHILGADKDLGEFLCEVMYGPSGKSFRSGHFSAIVATPHVL
jgi:hypothetical protein